MESLGSRSADDSEHNDDDDNDDDELDIFGGSTTGSGRKADESSLPSRSRTGSEGDGFGSGRMTEAFGQPRSHKGSRAAGTGLGMGLLKGISPLSIGIAAGLPVGGGSGARAAARRKK